MTNQNYSTILCEQKNDVLSISLNRPDLRNAFNDEVINELKTVFSQKASKPDIRVVLLKGEGKVFSAGGDLNWMKKAATYTREKNIQDALTLSQLLETMNTFPKPLIGVVHGAVLGGGMGLVSICDYVMATDDTKFGFSEVKLGLIPAVIGPFVIKKIGYSQTKAYFLSGEQFDAKRAYELGLVHQIIKMGELDEAIQKCCLNFLSNSPKAMEVAKNFIEQINSNNLKNKGLLASETLADLRASPEGQEGIKAFLEKRKPSWLR